MPLSSRGLAAHAFRVTAFADVLHRQCGVLTTPSRIAAAMAERPKMRRRADLLAVFTDLAEGVQSLLELRYPTWRAPFATCAETMPASLRERRHCATGGQMSPSARVKSPRR
jgi:hypothetical protein